MRDLVRHSFLSIIFISVFTPFNTLASSQSDLIKDKIIQQSIDGYSGNCPCPYFTDRAGRKCGKRSAYSRAGGASPLCYRTDVSDDMVKQFRGK